MMELDRQIIEAVLKKNNLHSLDEYKRFSSGIISRVYDLGNFVLKIEGDHEDVKGILKPQLEVMNRLAKLGARVSKVIDYGEFMDKAYLLMEKIPGTILVYSWLNFTTKQKENFIAQVCEQLKIFHSIKFDTYAIPIHNSRPVRNLLETVESLINFKRIDKSKLKQEYVEDVELLEKFYLDNKHVLDEANTAVFVHSDIHLENIFYEENRLTGIIDFDWVSQAPKDYELSKITGFFYEPLKTVEEKLEPLYKGHRMTEEYGWLKKYYPQLFEVDNLLTRIRLFSLEDMTNTIFDYQQGRWSENTMIGLKKSVDDYFRGGWLTEVLGLGVLLFISLR